MLDEVEPYFEGIVTMRDWRGRQSSAGDVKRNVPPMIYQRRLRQADLADDLRPHVQRRQGVLPVFKDENGPGIISHDLQT